ncbi:MAG TPA: efflux RND transporter permease subunit, partial [Candidatus Wallbacteria bacterium]|nr:efflux RND transporter permease subunit [Candidatus Wallbacteria bacterium]
MSLRQLKDISKDLKDDIEGIKGVLEVEVAGGREREIHIEVDPDLLALYAIPFTTLYTVIASENQNVSGGNIAMGDGRYQIRVPGEFKSIDEFKRLIVASVKGSPVYLSDIAAIKDSYKDVTTDSKFNFKNSVNLYIKKRVGENIIKIVEAVNVCLAERMKVLPKNLKLTKLMDRSRDVRMMLDDLENNIYAGFILVVLVLMFSMGLLNAFLVSTAVPLSMLLSFTILNAMGITLNMVTLFSLMLALGMLVDNAIVVIENIYRFTNQGVPKVEAAIIATSEVAIPVLNSTLTTVVAFIPMLYWPGIMGEFMKYLPITLIVTLSSSLLVALTINPVLCSIFMRVPKGVKQAMNEDEILKAGEMPLQGGGIIIRTYEYMLRSALNSRISVLLSSALLLVLFFMFWFYRTGIERPVEFFPSMEPTTCFVNIDPPEGTDMDALKNIAAEVEKRIVSYNNVPEKFRTEGGKPPALKDSEKKVLEHYKKIEGIEGEAVVSDLQNIRYIYTKLNSQTLKGGDFGFESNLPNHIGIQFHDFNGRVESSKKTLDRIRERLKGIAGATLSVGENQDGPPVGAPINIEISGDDFAVLGMISAKVRQALTKIPHVYDIEDNYVRGTPNFEVIVDRKKAGLYGLTVGMIGTVVKTAFNGWNVSTYREGDSDYDIVLKLKKSYRQDVDVFKKLFIPAPAGPLIPLSDIVSLHYTGGLGSISRINHQRVVTVKAKVDQAKMPGPVARAAAEKLLEQYDLPAGYSVKFTGENQEQDDAQDFLSKAFLTALVLVFMVLVMQFDSIVQVMIIMFSIILSLGGVFLALGLADIPFGIIMTGIGVISLAGVAVNNAIVLLDYINQLLIRGYSLTEAVVAGGKTRFRPVYLTAITSILGLVPMITGISFDFKKMEWLTNSE